MSLLTRPSQIGNALSRVSSVPEIRFALRADLQEGATAALAEILRARFIARAHTSAD